MFGQRRSEIYDERLNKDRRVILDSPSVRRRSPPGPSLGWSHTLSAWRHRGIGVTAGWTYNGIGGGEDATVGECTVVFSKNFAAVVDFFAIRILDIVDTISVGLPLSVTPRGQHCHFHRRSGL